MKPISFSAAFLPLFATVSALAQTPTPQGEIKGDAWAHSAESLAAAVQQADICVPATVTGGAIFCGKLKDLPRFSGGSGSAASAPVVVFLHGSSGLALKAIGEWQRWLAGMGVASVAPDSFALAGRVTYKSPIDKDSYERIHALRASEITPTVAAVRALPWADTRRLVLAGTSEGAVPAARHAGTEFAARMLYAWSCEDNYFVKGPRSAFEAGKPVLNVISATDPFFSKANAWLGNAEAQGHCGAALKDNAQAAVVLVPNAPHTLLMLPAARAATLGFLQQLPRP